MTEPRLLTDKEAADYLAVPVAEIRRLGVGRLMLGTRARYDRRAIDAYLDARTGLGPVSSGGPSTQGDDDPDAAFDRFAERHAHAARPA